ncbi:MAG: flagellar hook basal-body protein [Myxococcaceae bacterium]|nr:flagellar hook basal-body protein [Myxococcaceae bacterium]
MADGMYVSMNGAAARAAQLESVSDNLANAQTPGFKASRPVFQSFLAESGEAELAYPAVVRASVDLRPGATMVTGNQTDVMPDPGAFFAITLPDGTQGFTRAGRLIADATGLLTVNGRPIMGQNGQAVSLPPGAPWSVDQKGAILSNGLEVGRLALFQLPPNVERVGESMLRLTDGGQALPVEAKVRPGELELSNASPLEAAVQMISAQRSFDSSMQAVQTYRRMDERANELGRVR